MAKDGVKEAATNRVENNMHPVDEYTKAIGVCGRWQIMILLVAVVPVNFMLHWNLFGIVYLAAKTTYRCMDTNLTADIQNSTCYEDCTKYEYFEDTIISEWGLICEKSWLASFAQTIYMFGILIGCPVFGILADRYGRRSVAVYTSLAKLVFCFILPFSPTYWFFATIRFLTGFSSAGCMVTCFVVLMEIVAPSKRELMSALYGVPLSLGHAVMPLFGYYLRSWNAYALGIAIPHLFFLFYIIYTPESPKWLISVGKLEEACIEMTKAAKMNKLPTENMLNVVEALAKEANNNLGLETQKASMFDLVKISKWRTMTVWMCLIWFLMSISYFGANQYIGQTSSISNPYLNFSLVGLIDIPSVFIACYLAKKVGRRPALLIVCAVAAVGSGLLALPDHMPILKTTLGVIGVTATTCICCVVRLHTSEVFPTVARNIAMGVGFMASRAGSMVAPFIANLDVDMPWVTPAIFAVSAVLIAAMVMCLPETRGKKLEDHFDIGPSLKK